MFNFLNSFLDNNKCKRCIKKCNVVILEHNDYKEIKRWNKFCNSLSLEYKNHWNEKEMISK